MIGLLFGSISDFWKMLVVGSLSPVWWAVVPTHALAVWIAWKAHPAERTKAMALFPMVDAVLFLATLLTVILGYYYITDNVLWLPEANLPRAFFMGFLIYVGTRTWLNPKVAERRTVVAAYWRKATARFRRDPSKPRRGTLPMAVIGPDGTTTTQWVDVQRRGFFGRVHAAIVTASVAVTATINGLWSFVPDYIRWPVEHLGFVWRAMKMGLHFL